MWWPGMSRRERSGRKTMPGMSEKQVERFLEYLRTQIEHLTKERETWKRENRDDEAYTVKRQRKELEYAEYVFRCLVEGREP
jgi:hypothetical protein